MSVERKYQFLEAAYPNMLDGIGTLIQKGKISNRFESLSLSAEELDSLEKAKSLCELRIIDLWNDQSTEEFKALNSTYFDIASQLPIENSDEYIIYEYIKLITCGYLGEGWHLVRRFLNSRDELITRLVISESWNSRLLTKSFKALVGLIRKNNWREIETSIGLINELRSEQSEFENLFLNQSTDNERPFGAAELVALYHFAKSVEVLGGYLLEGRPPEPETQIRYHLNFAKEYATKASNISLELLFQFFDSLSTKLIRNTIWYNTRGVNSRVTRFNNFISHKDDRGIFELLYPQKEALGELLNPAHSTIVVNLPTSSGKTMIAEYRLLQALNQFSADGGWVAYVVPSRALVNQVYIQLQQDLGSIGIKIEKVSGALELDGFEESLLERDSQNSIFDVLVTTYEKLHLMIRQGHGASDERPLVLAVVDEAHNIEDESRGLNLELLLATIKNDCERANFLLMTPDISNSAELARWLGGERGKDLQMSLHWWQPNERIIGALMVEGRARNFKINLKTLLSTKGTFTIDDDILLADYENYNQKVSDFYGANGSHKKLSTILASKTIKLEQPTVLLARHPAETFEIAQELYDSSTTAFPVDSEVELVRRYVESELGNTFPLSQFLSKRIGVHSSALPDEIKILIEELMNKEKLQVLIATTTIAQGINFPISSVIMGSYKYPSRAGAKEMPVRDFWNLAGRVGRAGQDGMGWVGIALKNDEELATVGRYIGTVAADLHSQLIEIINSALAQPDIEFERWLFRDERWSAVLQYISHLYSQTQQLDTFLSQLEQKLQGTLGYTQLNQRQKEYLRTNIRQYASTLNAASAKLSDDTGFSTVSVRNLIGKLHATGMTGSDWRRNQLFSEQNQNLQKLIGIMLETPEVRRSMEEISQGDTVLDRTTISRLIIDWVNGKDIAFLADKYFRSETTSKAIEKCAKALYKNIANAATWGLAAIQKMPTSGIGWDSLSEVEKKRMANLPALIHYGVNTDEAVLMRKNNIPRSIAKTVGELYSASVGGEIFGKGTSEITTWLSGLDSATWEHVRPRNARMSGTDYKMIWEKLSGIR